jgi:hypothetical protein
MKRKEMDDPMRNDGLDDLVVEIREDGKMLKHLRSRLGEEMSKYMSGEPSDFITYHSAVITLEKKLDGELDFDENDLC